MKKGITFLFAVAMSVATMFASPVKIGNLYYELNDENHTAEFAAMPSGKYSGSISIPATVTSDASVTYNVTSIAEYACYSCLDLTAVTIPNSIVTVGDFAFYDCPKLESIVYNDHVFAHLPQSYSGKYTIPSGVELIAGGAFSYCTELTTLEIPSSVNKIGEARPFYGCSNLTAINVVKDNNTFCSENGVVYSKDKTILVACPNGKTGNYSVPSGVTTIGSYAFGACKKLKNVILPSTLTLIESDAFFNSTALTTINIPNSVTAIGKYAFAYCESMTSVTIGTGVKTIDEYAFYSCIALSSITCRAITPPVCSADNVFSQVDKTIPLYVPKNSVEVYIRTDVWKLFKNNTYPIGTAVEAVNEASEIKSHKLMKNGVLYIEKDGEIFDVRGAKVE